MAAKTRTLFLIPSLLALLIAAVVGSLGIGRYTVLVRDIGAIVLSSSWGSSLFFDDTREIIILLVRMPRVLLATMAGAGLAMAGAAMQGVFRNPLVGPEVVGVSMGATFGGVLSIMLGWSMIATVGMAFLFGAFALVSAFSINQLSGKSGILGLVLAGVIIGSLFGALTGICQYLANPESNLPGIVYWLMGSFASADYSRVSVMTGAMLISGTGLLALSWQINLLSLGETDASALGVNVNRLRWLVVALVALIVAAQVSVSGGVGWVGLVIPHLARMLVGPEHSRLIPVSGLLGGLYLLLMDDIARSLTTQEIPISIMTSIVGTPIFLILFLKLQGKGWSND